MFRNNRGLSDTATNLASQFIIVLGGMAFQSALAWWLAPAGRGILAICLATATVSAVVFTLGCDRAIQVHLLLKQLSESQALTLSVLSALGGAFAAIVAWYVARQLSFEYTNRLAHFHIPWVLALLPTIALKTSLQLLLNAVRRFREIAILNVIGIVAQLIFTLVLVQYARCDVQGALAAITLSNIICIATALVFLHIIDRADVRWPTPGVPYTSILRYTITYLPARLGGLLNTSLTLFVIGSIGTLREIGILSLALTLMERTLLISDALSQSLEPRIGNQSRRCHDLVAQCCRLSAVAVGSIVIVVACSGPFIIPMLFSTEFADTSILLLPLGVGFILRSAVKPILVFFVVRRPSVVSLALTVDALVSVYTVPPLFRSGGLLAATIGITTGAIASAIILDSLFRAETKMGLRKSWCWTNSDTRFVTSRLRSFWQ